MTPEPSRRYLALFFPLLSADRWRREHPAEDRAALVFVEKQQNAMRIAASSEAALELGLIPGLALADARARVPDLKAVEHDAQADALLLARIADDCERYTPMVALDPPSGLTLDITGCAHLWGGEAGLTDGVIGRLAVHGLKVRTAIAETPDRARALARHGEPLPIAALDLEEEQARALRRAGLYTINDLARRPRTPLAARFGMAIVTKLARTLGEEDARITPRRVLPAITVLHRFAEPVARTDYVIEVVAELARQASEDLRERGEGGRRFSISLFRSDGDVRRLTVQTGAPTRDTALLLRLFDERIESLTDPLDPGFGYDAIRLDVQVTEPLTLAQIALGGQSQQEAANALIDRLSVRLGKTRVRRFAPGNSHVPELASFALPAINRVSFAPHPPPESGEPPLRPCHLFDPPQPVEVMAEVPDGPPRIFRWRRQMHRVRLAEGPERIGPEWWRRKAGYRPDQGGRTRDYFRVEDEAGRRFWLFRRGLYEEADSPAWYLHGLFA